MSGLSVRFYLGYWTIFSGKQPVISCATLAEAQAAVAELS